MPVSPLLLTPRVLQQSADLEGLGLLPYRPSPFGVLAASLARALLPFAMVREQRRMEEEERKREQAEALWRALSLYPPGTPEYATVFRRWQEAQFGTPQRAEKAPPPPTPTAPPTPPTGQPPTPTAPTTAPTETLLPPPPPDPVQQMQLALTRLQMLNEASKMAAQSPDFYPVVRDLLGTVGINLPEKPPTDPFERLQFINSFWQTWRNTPQSLRPWVARYAQQIGERFGVSFPESIFEITMTPEEERQMQLADAEIRAAQARATTLEQQNKPLRESLPPEVAKMIEQRPGGQVFLNAPLYLVEPVAHQFVKDLVAGDLEPATQVLTPSAIRFLRERMGLTEEQIRKLTVADIKARFPNLLVGNGTIAEVFGEDWKNIVAQNPFLAPLGHLWATPELMAQVAGTVAELSTQATERMRAYLLNVRKLIDDAVTKGSAPEWIGHLIGIHNGLAERLGEPVISTEEAQRMMQRAAQLLQLNELEKKTRIEQGFVNMWAKRQEVALSAARVNIARAGLGLRAQELGLREREFGVKQAQLGLSAQAELRKMQEAFNEEVRQRFNTVLTRGIPIRVTVQGRPMAVQWTTLPGGGKGLGALVGWRELRYDAKKKEWVSEPVSFEKQADITRAVWEHIRQQVAREFGLSPRPSPAQQLRQRKPQPTTKKKEKVILWRE